MFKMTIDSIINYSNNIPTEIKIEEESEDQRFKLINELEEEDKLVVLKIIDTMLTKKKFKDFFDKNIATL